MPLEFTKCKPSSLPSSLFSFFLLLVCLNLSLSLRSTDTALINFFLIPSIPQYIKIEIEIEIEIEIKIKIKNKNKLLDIHPSNSKSFGH
jgi:hypothetical protein